MKKNSILCKISKLLVLFILIGFIVPPGVMAQTEKGIALYNNWEYKRAEAVLSDQIEKNPADIKAGYYLGLALLMQEKKEEALKAFQKAKVSVKQAKISKNDPVRGQLEIALAWVCLDQKKTMEAWNHIKAAEKEKADPADIHTYRGAYYLEKGEVEKALGELEKAVELKSENPYTFFYAGIVFLRSERPTNVLNAVDMFKIFLELAPYAPEAEKIKFFVDNLC